VGRGRKFEGRPGRARLPQTSRGVRSLDEAQTCGPALDGVSMSQRRGRLKWNVIDQCWSARGQAFDPITPIARSNVKLPPRTTRVREPQTRGIGATCDERLPRVAGERILL